MTNLSTTLPDVDVLVEVSGCLTTCAHCWALGGRYGAMPFDDAAFALDGLAGYCGDRGLTYTAYPMHEVTAHPAAAEMIRLFTPHLGGAYDPILTPGAPLAARPDWREIVEAAKECGAHALWVAFHGFGEEHDRQLARPGAFAETCLAVRRAAACGLGTGANVFLTQPGLGGFGRLLETLRELPLGKLWVGPGAYRPTGRGRRYERLRPSLEELRAVAERVLEASDLETGIWSDLSAYTEAAWRRRALEGDWPAAERWRVRRHLFVVRRNLDLFTGATGRYVHRHGNLRRDGVEAALDRALAAGPVSDEEIYFGVDGGSSRELAARRADPESTRVHFDACSIRYRWLDRAPADA